jgi:hypothetical protein
MARPKKQGLDYFTNDVNFYQDIKIRKLIRHKGVQAVSVYHILLCQIYASGYYLPWDEDLPFIVSEISGLEEDTIQDIINYCITIGLFDKTVFDTHQVLTSHGIQERYISFCTVAKRKFPDNTPYLVVNLNPNQVNSDKKVVSSEQTLFNSEEINNNLEETPNNSGKSTQSKGEESKGEHSSSADTRAREGEGPVVGADDQTVCADVDAEITVLRASPIWKEQVFMRFKFLGVNEQLLDEYLQRWGQEVKISGKRHQNLGDAKHHFSSWMIIQEDKLNKKNRTNGTDSNNGYRTGEDIYTGAVNIIKDLRSGGGTPQKELPVV